MGTAGRKQLHTASSEIQHTRLPRALVVTITVLLSLFSLQRIIGKQQLGN